LISIDLKISPFYFIDSEPEMNKGYADLFFRKDYSVTDLTNYEYLVELKYIKSEALPKDKTKIKALINS
jgi:hypothetical protein